MIDDPVQTQLLLSAMRANLPFAVRLTPQLIDTLKSDTVKPVQKVTSIYYAGDEGGIVCYLERDAEGEQLVCSLTHLSVPDGTSFGRSIARYQKHRIKRLKRI